MADKALMSRYIYTTDRQNVNYDLEQSSKKKKTTNNNSKRIVNNIQQAVQAAEQLPTMEYQHRLHGRLDSLVAVIDPILNILESRDKTKIRIPFLYVATIWKGHASTSNHGYT
jgi:hypothetical protein